MYDLFSQDRYRYRVSSFQVKQERLCHKGGKLETTPRSCLLSSIHFCLLLFPSSSFSIMINNVLIKWKLLHSKCWRSLLRQVIKFLEISKNFLELYYWTWSVLKVTWGCLIQLNSVPQSWNSCYNCSVTTSGYGTDIANRAFLPRHKTELENACVENRTEDTVV